MRGFFGCSPNQLSVVSFHFGPTSAKKTLAIQFLSNVVRSVAGGLFWGFRQTVAVFSGASTYSSTGAPSRWKNLGAYTRCFSFLFLLVLKLPGIIGPADSASAGSRVLGLCDALVLNRAIAALRRGLRSFPYWTEVHPEATMEPAVNAEGSMAYSVEGLGPRR